MQRSSTLYTILFATAICVVCGIMVSSAAVSLFERQDFNAALDKRKKVLEAVGIIETNQAVSPEEVEEFFVDFETVALDMTSKTEDPSFDLEGFDQAKAQSDPSTSYAAPANAASVKRIPNHVQIYKLTDDAGELATVVLPIEGLGLWGTLYGYIAIDPRANEVRGITYYQHKETPGLGGEVDNPRWKGLWPGRKIWSADGSEVQIEVIKGNAGSVEDAPYRVDGLSGATITSRGVTNMIHFWMGADGYGPYLESLGAPAPAGAGGAS